MAALLDAARAAAHPFLPERRLTAAFRVGSNSSSDNRRNRHRPPRPEDKREFRAMFKKISLATAAVVAAFTAMPSAAEARHRDGYYDYGRYERGYRGDRYYGRGDRYYGRNGYYGRGRHYGRRCSGTTGTIVGGVAGALLGREIDRSDRRGRYGRRDSGTTGAIIGGAIGALAGRSIDKSSCRR
jgi:hypothetical protein